MLGSSEQPVSRIYSSYKPISSTNIGGESDAVIFWKILIFIIKVVESSAKNVNWWSEKVLCVKY